MADESAVECPQCGHTNEPVEEQCSKCYVDLEWALERGSQYWLEDAATRPPLILLSDDETAVQTLVGIMLERAGYRVVKAPGAYITLELAERLRPDLIITDFGKPDMIGPEMIARLKSDPDLRDIPVILLSSHGDYESVRMAMEAGAIRCLTKPILHKDLIAIVAPVLAGDIFPLVLFVHDKTPLSLHASIAEKYRILAPYSHDEAIRAARQLNPDLIAIGVHLSDMSGLDILAELKTDDATRNIPVVMLAEGSPLIPRLLNHVRTRAHALGAHAVYSGSLNSERLHDVFQAVLEER